MTKEIRPTEPTITISVPESIGKIIDEYGDEDDIRNAIVAYSNPSIDKIEFLSSYCYDSEYTYIVDISNKNDAAVYCVEFSGDCTKINLYKKDKLSAAYNKLHKLIDQNFYIYFYGYKAYLSLNCKNPEATEEEIYVAREDLADQLQENPLKPKVQFLGRSGGNLVLISLCQPGYTSPIKIELDDGQDHENYATQLINVLSIESVNEIVGLLELLGGAVNSFKVNSHV